MSYTLRVHLPQDELWFVAEWVKNNTNLCLIVQEEATRTHFHALFTCPKTIEQFRKDLRKRFPQLEGNKTYSLKNVKSQKGIEDYLCKGEAKGILPVILKKSSSWTDEKILQHHTSYWERHVTEEESNKQAKQGSDSVISTTSGKVKIRTPTAIEKIAAKVLRQYGQDEVDKWANNEITRSKVIRVMMEYLGESGRGFDMIILKRLYYGVIHQLMPVQSTHVWEDALVRFLDTDR